MGVFVLPIILLFVVGCAIILAILLLCRRKAPAQTTYGRDASSSSSNNLVSQTVSGSTSVVSLLQCIECVPSTPPSIPPRWQLFHPGPPPIPPRSPPVPPRPMLVSKTQVRMSSTKASGRRDPTLLHPADSGRRDPKHRLMASRSTEQSMDSEGLPSTPQYMETRNAFDCRAANIYGNIYERELYDDVAGIPYVASGRLDVAHEYANLSHLYLYRESYLYDDVEGRYSSITSPAKCDDNRRFPPDNYGVNFPLDARKRREARINAVASYIEANEITPLSLALFKAEIAAREREVTRKALERQAEALYRERQRQAGLNRNKKRRLFSIIL